MLSIFKGEQKEGWMQSVQWRSQQASGLPISSAKSPSHVFDSSENYIGMGHRKVLKLKN